MSDDADRVGWGLLLDVYRKAANRPIDIGDTSRGGISSRFSTLLLVGIVDYRHVTKRLVMGTADGQARVDWVQRHMRRSEPSDDQPPVWLVLGKHGRDDQFLVPGDLTQRQPDGRQWAAGGNYANGNFQFDELVGHRYPVRIHDFELFRERERG